MKGGDRVRVKATGFFHGAEGVVKRVWRNEEDPIEVLFPDIDSDEGGARMHFEEMDLEIIKAA